LAEATDFTTDSILLVGVVVGGEGGSEEFWNKGQEDILQSLVADEELLGCHPV
jgi:hypothetical protein